MVHFPALPFSFCLVCSPTKCTAYRVIAWQSHDGDAFAPVAINVAEIAPGDVDWLTGGGNIGAQVIRLADGEEVRHIHAFDDRHAWELLDEHCRDYKGQ